MSRFNDLSDCFSPAGLSKIKKNIILPGRQSLRYGRSSQNVGNADGPKDLRAASVCNESYYHIIEFADGKQE